jgi:CTP:molybdopterin cytidylyltransferase MocA
MGTPKALMDISGRSWWQIQHERLEAARVPSTWVVSPDVHAAMTAPGAPPVRAIDSSPQLPMFASFLRGIDSLRADPPQGVFVLPVDVPAPDRAVWDSLCDLDQVSIPSYMDIRGHPIYLPWRWIDEVLRASPDSASVSLLRLDRLVEPVARFVNVHDRSVAFNLNTPDDVRRWLAGDEPPPVRA